MLADGLPPAASAGGSSSGGRKLWAPLTFSVALTRVSPLSHSSPGRISLAAISCLIALSFLFAGLLSFFVPKPAVMAKYSEALQVGRVIGDVLDPFTPSVDLKVEYNGRRVNNGVELKPSETASTPKVEIAGRASAELYTLVMVDPDAPSPSEPSAREWLHWIVTDIPGAGTVPESGTVVLDYNGPTPPIGIHRYVFVLFKQKGPIKIPPLESRKNFNTRWFAVTYDLGLPVSAVYFNAQKEGGSATRRR